MNTIHPHSDQPALRWYSYFVCGSVLFLIFFGALVKSYNAGLAVPDWPTSYGDNMFLFPPSKWIGTIFYEHVHRLIASGVGLLTLILAIWLTWREPRRGIRLLGAFALIVVCLQGLLGGLTVLYQLPTAISVSHGVLAQTFFVITLVLAYSQSKEWKARANTVATISERRVFRMATVISVAVYIQLIIGALMRHTEAGLAVLDFPTTTGRWLPVMNEDAVTDANALRALYNLVPIELDQLAIHIAHRWGALVVTLVALGGLFQIALLRQSLTPEIRRTGIFLAIVLLIQISLGIATVLTLKQEEITSLHVVIGALLLGVSTLLAMRSYGVSSRDGF